MLCFVSGVAVYESELAQTAEKGGSYEHHRVSYQIGVNSYSGYP